MNEQRESYIFKPLTNGKTVGREKWMYEHVLSLYQFVFQNYTAAAEHEDPERYWAIYEDTDEMSHQLADDDYAVAAALIP